MLEIKTAKTHKGKRELEKRALKLISIHPLFLSLFVSFPRNSLHFPGNNFTGGIGEENTDLAWNKDQRRAERCAGTNLSPKEGLRRQVQPKEREHKALRGQWRDLS